MRVVWLAPEVEVAEAWKGAKEEVATVDAAVEAVTCEYGATAVVENGRDTVECVLSEECDDPPSAAFAAAKRMGEPAAAVGGPMPTAAGRTGEDWPEPRGW